MQPFNALIDRRTQIVLVVGAAVATAAVTSVYVHENLRGGGARTSFSTVLGVELVQWLLWAAAVPLMARVEQRFGVATSGWWRGIAAHIATALLIFLAINAALAPFVATFDLGYGPGSTLEILLGRAASKFFEGLGIYSVIAGVLWLFALSADRRRHELRAAQLEAELSAARSVEADGDRLVVNDGDRKLVFLPNEILYITASGAYVEIRTKRGTEVAREGIATLDSRLDPRTFIRVHRSAIINARHVVRFRGRGHGDGEIEMRDGKVLRVSRARRARVAQLLEPVS